MKTLLRFTCITIVSLWVSESFGATITLDATQQTWISPTNSSSYRTTPRGNDTTINVRSGGTSTSTATSSVRMYGVLEFDLSLVPGTITNAYLQLYMDPGQGNAGTVTQTLNFIPLQNPAYAGGPSGPTSGGDINQNTLTYAIYSAAGSYGPTDFGASQFGTISFTGAVPVSAYTQSLSTDATDLNYITGVQGSSLPHLGVLLVSNSNTAGTKHDWSNGNNATDGGVAHPPQLVVEYSTVPEPSTFALATLVLGSIFCVMRHHRTGEEA